MPRPRSCCTPSSGPAAETNDKNTNNWWKTLTWKYQGRQSSVSQALLWARDASISTSTVSSVEVTCCRKGSAITWASILVAGRFSAIIAIVDYCMVNTLAPKLLNADNACVWIKAIGYQQESVLIYAKPHSPCTLFESPIVLPLFISYAQIVILYIYRWWHPS